MSKSHTLTLNNGAVYQLAQILGAPGFLTEAADLYRAGEVLETQLLDLPAPPEQIAKGTDDLTAEKQVRAWQRKGENKIELSERQRDTAKKAVQACIGKGTLPPGAGSLCLLRELGLAPEA